MACLHMRYNDSNTEAKPKLADRTKPKWWVVMPIGSLISLTIKSVSMIVLLCTFLTRLSGIPPSDYTLATASRRRKA